MCSSGAQTPLPGVAHSLHEDAEIGSLCELLRVLSFNSVCCCRSPNGDVKAMRNHRSTTGQ